VENENIGNFQYTLLDLKGSILVSEKVLSSNQEEIDFQGLPNGTYILEVLQNKSLIKTFKIVKN
jgi:hypothetical protein